MQWMINRIFESKKHYSSSMDHVIPQVKFDEGSLNIWSRVFKYLASTSITWLSNVISTATGPDIIAGHHDELNQESFLFQSTILLQSSSKLQVIHLYFMLLITLEHTTILKSMKSSNSYTESTSLYHVSWTSEKYSHLKKGCQID